MAVKLPKALVKGIPLKPSTDFEAGLLKTNRGPAFLLRMPDMDLMLIGIAVYAAEDFEKERWFKALQPHFQKAIKLSARKATAPSLLKALRNPLYDWKVLNRTVFVIRHPDIVSPAFEYLRDSNITERIANPVIIKANEDYHNGKGSQLSDAEFDAWEKYYKANGGDWPLTGKVGATVSSERKKVTLPIQMGSLKKASDPKELSKWTGTVAGKVIATPKLDGISLQLVYQGGKLKAAYTRGDGSVGQDVTLQAQAMKIPTRIRDAGTYVIRGEACMREADFEKYFSKDNGGDFANSRNMSAGLFNRKSLSPDHLSALAKIKYIVYSLHKDKAEAGDKAQQLKTLATWGFDAAPYAYVNISRDKDVLPKLKKEWERKLDITLDGVVIEADDLKARKKLGNETNSINPRYARAWKPENVGVKTTVTDVVWKISRHGLWKPVVHIEPTKLSGVTVKKATGHNAQNIWDNGIGKGAIITVFRSGDVIPYIDSVIKRVAPQMPPAGKWKWNATKKDALSTEGGGETQTIKKLVHFFKTLGVEYFSDKTCAALVRDGVDSPSKVFKLGRKGFMRMERVGETSADRLFKQLDALKSGVPMYKLAYASSLFGSNFGSTKLREIFKALGDKVLEMEPQKAALAISNLSGFSLASAKTFADTMSAFNAFRRQLGPYLTTTAAAKPKSSKASAMQVVLTGTRDGDITDWVESNGGKIASSVSAKTTLVVAKDAGYSSDKRTKAKSLGITVLTVDQFKSKYMR